MKDIFGREDFKNCTSSALSSLASVQIFKCHLSNYWTPEFFETL